MIKLGLFLASVELLFLFHHTLLSIYVHVHLPLLRMGCPSVYHDLSRSHTINEETKKKGWVAPEPSS